jgi:hypothetical protein
MYEERVVVTHTQVELPNYDAHNNSRHLRPFNDFEEEESRRRAAESRYNPNEQYYPNNNYANL